jgi:PTS system nitrogen regulatory IIA component
MQLSVKDAAGLLNVSEKTIYRWIRHELIPVYRINDEFRFNRAELLEWATSRLIQISPDVFPAEEGRPLPSLSEALRALKLPADVDREFLYQVLLARETLGSTGVGNGIAIPHVRNPVVLHVAQPTVTLCFLEHPIDFAAIDRQPVDTLFTLISPTVRVHLHLLSRLGFLLQNRDFRAALTPQSSPDELLAALARAEAGVHVR